MAPKKKNDDENATAAAKPAEQVTPGVVPVPAAESAPPPKEDEDDDMFADTVAEQADEVFDDVADPQTEMLVPDGTSGVLEGSEQDGLFFTHHCHCNRNCMIPPLQSKSSL